MALDRTVDITLRRLLCIRIAFIEILLTSGQADFDLDKASFQIDLERYEGQPLFADLRVRDLSDLGRPLRPRRLLYRGGLQ